jgi:outer membrane biosynthesis protein TonB
MRIALALLASALAVIALYAGITRLSKAPDPQPYPNVEITLIEAEFERAMDAAELSARRHDDPPAIDSARPPSCVASLREPPAFPRRGERWLRNGPVSVHVRFEIDRDGRPFNIQASSETGAMPFEAAAENAIANWRYDCTLAEPDPIEMTFLFEYED